MKKTHTFYLFFLFIPFICNSQILPKINIVIAQDSINVLEENPFTSEDVHGIFVAETGDIPVPQVIENVELKYRGAYALLNLINDYKGSLKRRNWKVKTPKNQQYMNRRELNFNYQNHVREFMADYLMNKAKIPLAQSRFVLLSVNGVSHGLYFQIEDIDNKNYLFETFGNKDGDLYKSAYDSPVDPDNRNWADFSYLGPNDSDYFLHYSKKTNKDGVAATDYSSIRKFTEMINFTPDEDFEVMVKNNFAWENFIRYLVVSNFISNWDGYPQRPKNSWLYHNPKDGKWNFVPWDLDATFEPITVGANLGMNMMGQYCSILHYMDEYEPYQPGAASETKERPLVWRMMKVPFYRNYYVDEYKRAMSTYLSKPMINNVLDSISAVIKLNQSTANWNSFAATVTQTKTFVNNKTTAVTNELALLPNALQLTNTNGSEIKIYPTPANEYFTLAINIESSTDLSVEVFDLAGILLKSICQQPIFQGKQTLEFTTENLTSGNYFLRIKEGKNVYVKKLFIYK
jgi:spore coat protein CotH